MTQTARKIIDFNGSWSFRKGDSEIVCVNLPHTWNVKDGTDGGNDYWRGTAEYRKTFAKPKLLSGERLFIEFQGAAMTAEP